MQIDSDISIMVQFDRGCFSATKMIKSAGFQVSTVGWFDLELSFQRVFACGWPRRWQSSGFCGCKGNPIWPSGSLEILPTIIWTNQPTLGTSIRWSPYSRTAPLSWSWDLTNVGPTKSLTLSPGDLRVAMNHSLIFFDVWGWLFDGRIWWRYVLFP